MTQRRFTILVVDDDADSGEDVLHMFQADPATWSCAMSTCPRPRGPADFIAKPATGP